MRLCFFTQQGAKPRGVSGIAVGYEQILLQLVEVKGVPINCQKHVINILEGHTMQRWGEEDWGKSAIFWRCGLVEGVLAEEGSGSAQVLDAPTKILNTHRAPTPHHTTQHNTTTNPAQGGLGQGRGERLGWGPAQGGPLPRKQDMSTNCSEQQANVFSVKNGSQGFGQNSLIKKSCLGQKWCGPEVVRAPKWSEKQKKT